MDFLRREDEINAIVPGVADVYRRLTEPIMTKIASWLDYVDKQQ